MFVGPFGRRTAPYDPDIVRIAIVTFDGFNEIDSFVALNILLVVNFGLATIAPENGPLEIAPGTHRMPRTDALRALAAAEIGMQPVPLEIGDVLIRHPWALHRGTPNVTDTPRALVNVRYVRRWYADNSREVDSMPRAVWESLTPEQRDMMRFPVAD
jgi:ectoine hydroxylase-related dioxygenase (phytanoyl-CoA dioxygenase family)